MYVELLETQHILAIDPGPETGLAICRGDQFEVWTLDLKDTVVPHYRLRRELDSLSVDYLVLEPFEFRKDKDRDKIDYAAAEYVGVIKGWAQDIGVTVHLQGSSTIHTGSFFAGKAGRDKLRKMVPGTLRNRTMTEHSWDALKHLMHYRIFRLSETRWLEKLK